MPTLRIVQCRSDRRGDTMTLSIEHQQGEVSGAAPFVVTRTSSVIFVEEAFSTFSFANSFVSQWLKENDGVWKVTSDTFHGRTDPNTLGVARFRKGADMLTLSVLKNLLSSMYTVNVAASCSLDGIVSGTGVANNNVRHFTTEAQAREFAANCVSRLKHKGWQQRFLDADYPVSGALKTRREGAQW